MSDYCTLYGEIENWPTMSEMASILKRAGLNIHVGRYSIRIEDCECFTFQEYRGDLGDPQFEVEASSLATMIHDANLVSAALVASNIRHRMEVYLANDNELIAYIHHQWPLEEAS